jgi:hypothetical protein
MKNDGLVKTCLDSNARIYKGALYNVGPIYGDDYTGVHTYSQVLFPFLTDCWKNGIEFTWFGDTLVNKQDNEKATELIDKKIINPIINKPLIREKPCSVDLLNPEEYDFLLLQPRPKENFIESSNVDYLINKFTKAKKRVFLFEQDMFPMKEEWTKNEFITHLRPYIAKSDLNWLDSREFLFWHSNYQGKLNYPSGNDLERVWDFIYLGNVYGRQDSFKRFLGDVDIEKNAVFGNWISTDTKREFSSQFNNLNFYGTTNHNLTIPLINAAKFTLQILPDWAIEKGLMTARVFNAVSAKTLCFIDNRIFGAEYLFPKELLVSNSKEMIEKIKYFKDNPIEYRRVMEERDKLMEKHSVNKRVEQFKSMLEELVK